MVKAEAIYSFHVSDPDSNKVFGLREALGKLISRMGAAEVKVTCSFHLSDPDTRKIANLRRSLKEKSPERELSVLWKAICFDSSTKRVAFEDWGFDVRDVDLNEVSRLHEMLSELCQKLKLEL